mmetsp:Transcript_10843/g.22274  ORF Transcript_10843/g.22274 Transcript_10843/m.22274 type:complete len:153 (-) Transcript_10843:280-738(-)
MSGTYVTSIDMLHGIAVGHLYYFLVQVLPLQLPGNRQLLKTPNFLVEWFHGPGFEETQQVETPPPHQQQPQQDPPQPTTEGPSLSDTRQSATNEGRLPRGSPTTTPTTQPAEQQTTRSEAPSAATMRRRAAEAAMKRFQQQQEQPATANNEH